MSIKHERKARGELIIVTSLGTHYGYAPAPEEVGIDNPAQIAKSFDCLAGLRKPNEAMQSISYYRSSKVSRVQRQIERGTMWLTRS